VTRSTSYRIQHVTRNYTTLWDTTQLVVSRHHLSSYILNSPSSCHILSTGRQIFRNATAKLEGAAGYWKQKYRLERLVVQDGMYVSIFWLLGYATEGYDQRKMFRGVSKQRNHAAGPRQKPPRRFAPPLPRGESSPSPTPMGTGGRPTQPQAKSIRPNAAQRHYDHHGAGASTLAR